MSSDDPRPLDGYDVYSDEYRNCPHLMYEAIRTSGCPVAHSDKWGGSWMPTTYEDVYRIAQDPVRFSSRALEFTGVVPEVGRGLAIPPISSEPDVHAAHRELLEPFFTPARIAAIEPFTRQVARDLARGLASRGGGDAATEFAQPLALAVLARFLEVPEQRKAQFMDWALRVIKFGPFDQALRSAALEEAFNDLTMLLEERRAGQGDDVVSHIARGTLDGKPLALKHQVGTLLLLVLAGADTTWSALSSSLLHLAQNPDDCELLVARPELLRTTAVEELLRAYAPITISRVATEDTELHGRTIQANERVLLPWPAANRDPAVFEKPDEVQLERKRNRHLAFGTGIHRCLGAHLARMEIRVGIEEWLAVMPRFTLTDPEISWSRGQVRGPEHIQFKAV